MNRLLQDNAWRQLNAGALTQECRVQGDKRVTLERRDAGEVLVDRAGVSREYVAQALDPGPWRQPLEARQRRDVVPVDEHQLRCNFTRKPEGADVHVAWIGRRAAPPA